MGEMNTNEVINLLLSKENEISNKFHNTIIKLLRLGYDSDRGKAEVPDLIESINYSLDEIQRIIYRWDFRMDCLYNTNKIDNSMSNSERR